MLYYMINKNAQNVFNGVSDTGNISMQDVLMQMKTTKQKNNKKNLTIYMFLCIVYLKHIQMGKK